VHIFRGRQAPRKQTKEGDYMDFKHLTVGEKVELLFELREKKEELTKELTEFNKKIDALSFEVLQDMEDSGLNRIAVGAGSVTRSVKLYPKIENFEAFMRWCVENERFDMLQKRANGAPFREFYETNNEYPDGLDAYEKATLNVRRS